MLSHARVSTLVLVISLAMALGACKQQQAAKSNGNKNGAATGTGTGLGTSTGSLDSSSSGDCVASTGTGSGSATGSGTSTGTGTGDLTYDSGLNLTSSYNYNDHIKSILKNKCVACHGSGSNDGDLSTYTSVKNLKSSILNLTFGSSKTMPPSGSTQLTSTESSNLKNWLENGMPETSSSSGTSTGSSNDSTGSTTTGSSSNCGSSNTSTGSDDNSNGDEDSDSDSGTSAWDELLNPPEKKDCGNKVFDRAAKKCHKATIVTSYCNREGIIKKFKSLSPAVDVTTEFDKNVDTDKFEIDQCGEYNKEPIVFFIKKVETDEELSLKIRKLCKKGSSACDNN